MWSRMSGLRHLRATEAAQSSLRLYWILGGHVVQRVEMIPRWPRLLERKPFSLTGPGHAAREQHVGCVKLLRSGLPCSSGRAWPPGGQDCVSACSRSSTVHTPPLAFGKGSLGQLFEVLQCPWILLPAQLAWVWGLPFPTETCAQRKAAKQC